MLEHYRMGNSGNILTLVEADLGKQRAGRHKKHSLPLPAAQLRKNIAA